MSRDQELGASYMSEQEQLSITSGSVQHSTFQLSNGIELEVASCSGQPPLAAAPPLVFVHGLYHAAWCWEEHWLPWLAQRGYSCYAISLRGQGGSSAAAVTEDSEEGPSSSSSSSRDTLEMGHHVADLAEFLGSLQRPAVLVGHSLGGCIAQAYLSASISGPAQDSDSDSDSLESSGSSQATSTGQTSSSGAAGADAEATEQGELPALGGMVLVGAPCVGTLGLIKEFISDVGLGVFGRLLWVLVTGGPLKSQGAMRTCWFSEHVEEQHLARYYQSAASSSKVRPLAPDALMAWTEPQPPLEQVPPVLALVGSNDATVRPFQVKAAVEFWGAQYAELEDVAHDVMLDTHWLKGATALEAWLRATYPSAPIMGEDSPGDLLGQAPSDAAAQQQL